MERLNIVMFGHKRIPSREGGIEIVVEQLAKRMVEKGHEVTCYNRAGYHVSSQDYKNEKNVSYQGIQVKTVPTINRKGLAAVSSSVFASVFAAFSRAKVVHIHAEGPAVMCWLPKLFGKRVIVTVHGLDWQREKWKQGFASKYIKLGEQMAVKFANEIIVLSRNVQKYFEETYNRKTVYVPNGVEQGKMRSVDQIKTAFDLEKDSYILFLGRLVPEKGIHYLIDAFESVKTDKKLVIAGESSDTDEYTHRLQIMAKNDSRIIFTGFVQGELLEELYSNAYVYVLPSDLEGMPLTLLEAMGYGNCCLVSDIPECAEVVEDKAVIFEKGNIKDLQLKLQQLCDEEEIVASYKNDAADYICKKYVWDAITERTLGIYTGKEMLDESIDGEQVSVS